MEEIKLVLVRNFGLYDNEELCGASILTTEKIKNDKILLNEKFTELMQKMICSVEFEEEGLSPAQRVVYETIDIIKNTNGKVFIDIDRLKEFGYCTFFPELNN